MSQTINLDVTPGLFQSVLHLHQGDIGRECKINVVSRDGYEIPSGATFKIEGTKPSEMGFTITGSVSGNVVTFTTTKDMTSESGEIPAQMEISSGDNVIFASNFLLVVEKNVHDETVVDGTIDQFVPEMTLLVTDLKSDNASNIFVNGTYSPTNWRGVTMSWSGRVATLSGTVSGGDFTSPNIYSNTAEFPSGISAGDILTFKISSTNVNISLLAYFYINGSWANPEYISKTRQLVVPSNATGMLLRLYVANGFLATGTFKFDVFTVMQSDDTTEQAVPYILPNTTYDITALVEAVLNKYGMAVLGKGEYITTGITMPDYTTIRGAGRASKLKITTAGQNAITVGAGCTIEDIEIIGTLNAYPSDRATGSGIVIVGNGSDAPFKYHTKISNVTIHGFGEAGIYLNNTGEWVANGASISNCEIYFCYAGILTENYAEFHKVTNCVIRNCYAGIFNLSGNNIFVNCSLSNNFVGFMIPGSANPTVFGNPAHGALIGCTINHSNNNNGYAIILNGSCNNGFVFDGCHIWYGKVLNEGHKGVLFDGCMFGGTEVIIQNMANSATVLSGCMFKIAPSFTNWGNLVKNACYMFDGTAIN